MKPGLQRTLSIGFSASLLLSRAIPSAACGLGGPSITNLPPFALSGYQIYGLNPQGQVTGSLVISGVHGPHAILYSDTGLIDLGTLGGNSSFGFCINAIGQVAGQANLSIGGPSHAFLYNNGSMADLGTLGGSSSSAAAINDAGLVVGQSDLSGGAGPVAFRYANGTMSSLGTLGGTYSSAFAANNSGLIVGESTVSSGDLHGFSWADGSITDIGTLGGNYSSAFAVSPNGVIVGESAVASGDTHAFVSLGGSMMDLGTFGGTYSSAFAVNTNDQVVGNSDLLGDNASRGFFYANGTVTDIGALGGTNSDVWALNNLGQVVGNAELEDGSTHAFLWATNHMIDLNTLLPANSGWVLGNAHFINDAGRIVGLGTYNGSSQWFVLDLSTRNNNAPPVANAGPDQTVDCQAQVTLDGSGSQDPDNNPLTYEWSSSGSLLGTNATLNLPFPIGTNVITLKVTDPCGASSEDNVVVTVQDTTPPTGSCPNAVTASTDGNCQAPVPNLVPQVVATDNCTPTGSLVVTQSPAAGTLVGTGVHQITLTVTDSSGNHSSCAVPFTVSDTTAPAFVSVPGPITVSAGANCQGVVPNVLPNVVAADNCTPAGQLVLTQTPSAGASAGSGESIIAVTAMDAAGNSATTNVSLKVVDTTAPALVTVPPAITITAGDGCQGTIPNVVPGVVATDNCTPANQILITQSPAAGTVLPPGQYTLTIGATDLAGNSVSQDVPVTITGTNPPVIQAVSVSPNLLGPPNHALIPVTVSAVVSTGCSSQVVTKIVSITSNETLYPGEVQITGNLTALLAASRNGGGGGRIYTITVQSTDASGNSTTGVVTVFVPQGNGNSNTAAIAVRKK